MTVLARSFSHIAFTSASAFALSAVSIWRSKTLPWRTWPMPSKPRAPSAPSIALPCGSRTPFFSVTVTRALITVVFSCLFHQHGAGAAGRLVLVHDAKAARDFLVGLDQAAHVAAEPVLVHLFLGF